MASLLIATAVMFLLGLGLIGYAIKDFSKKKEKKLWTQTTGEIIQSNADDVVERMMKRERYSEVKHFEFDIRYAYRVNLTSYESSKVSEATYQGIRGVAYSEEELRGYAKQYQIGTKVNVYYDPENPENAILIPNAPAGRLVFLILVGVSVIFCGLSFLMVYYTSSSL